MIIGYVSERNCPPLIQNDIWLIQASKETWIEPGKTHLVHSGFFFEFPKQSSMLVFSYLDLLFKKSLIIANAPGTIDSDYRGELCCIVTNLSNKRAHLLEEEIIALGIREEVYQMHSPVEIEKNVIQFKLNQQSHKPLYQTEGSSGFDLHANLEESITIKPGEKKVIDTGLHVSIPKDFHLQIRCRSGLALKSGIIVLGAPLVLQGEQTIEVPLYNMSQESFFILPGMRIAQAICLETPSLAFSVVDKLSLTKRGSGGFGSTGS